MNSRSKGQRGEREWANILRVEFPDLAGEIRRGLQSRGGGAEVADVEGIPGYHFEVKRVENLAIWKSLAQAESDADPGDIPVLAFRRNFGKWYVAIDAAHFFDLLQSRQAPDSRSERPPGVVQDVSSGDVPPANTRIPRAA